MKKIIFASIILFAFSSLSENKDDSQTLKSDQELKQYYNALIEEYKKELSNVPSEVRKEVVEYRKAVAKLNKQKRDLYKSLSIQGQNYLKRESDFRNKLPIEPSKANDAMMRDEVDAKQSNK